MRRVIAAFLFLTLALSIFAAVEWSTTFPNCVAKETAQETAEQKQQSLAALKINVRCLGEFTETNHGPITAAFTVILGIATIFLWWATRDLVDGAEETARWQLRAYLSINPTFIENYGTKKRATINLVVKNHGQTPASRIRYKFSIEVMPDPLPEGFDFSNPQLEVTPDSTLFPSRDATDNMKTWFNNDRPFTEAEFDSVEADTHRIHVWGVMTYRDVFKRDRITIFNASVGGPDFRETQRQIRAGKANPGPGYIWVHAQDHNQST